MLAAEAEGMTSGSYVFIYLDNNIPGTAMQSHWFSTDSWSMGDSDDDEALEAFSNMLVVSMHGVLQLACSSKDDD